VTLFVVLMPFRFGLTSNVTSTVFWHVLFGGYNRVLKVGKHDSLARLMTLLLDTWMNLLRLCCSDDPSRLRVCRFGEVDARDLCTAKTSIAACKIPQG